MSDQKKLSRRSFLRISGATTAAALLAACAPATPAPTEAPAEEEPEPEPTEEPIEEPEPTPASAACRALRSVEERFERANNVEEMR